MRVLFISLPLFACSSATTTAPSSTVPPVKEVAPAASEPAAEARKGEFQGEIEFVSIKNGDTPVSAVIRDIAGAIQLGDKAEDGVHSAEGALTIPLTAVDSQLEIRDQRIMDVFFHAQETPSASFTIDGVKMPDGNEGAGWVDGTLTIGPYTQDVRGHFLGSSQEEGSWSFESGEPMVVSIESLGMGSRLKALMELCGHRSIDDSVEVRAKGLLRF